MASPLPTPQDANTILEAEELREKMLLAAQKAGASDIHIDPTENELLVRIRVDGVLHVWAKRPLLEHENLISHLKIYSGLDITRRSTPQEGHFTWIPPSQESANKGRIFNIRSSFFPSVYGEAVALRLFNRADLFIKLADLELEDQGRDAVRALINRPYGMVLIAGPAGSGKTTTLYSLLGELATESRNVVTLEDPVEYILPHVRQSQIEPEHNYTFAAGIRSILRQDPDVIMVGEIRDLETAENAVRVSLTGRLLLSTLHAYSSIGAVSRLLDMKIERDILAYALSAVISRRLVRRICQQCRAPYMPPASVLKTLDMSEHDTFFHGAGCDQCDHQGLRGRVGLFEVLMIDEDLRRMIVEGASLDVMLAAIQKKGFRTLRDDGIAKIHAGLTSPEEIVKAIV
ncbi:MAG: type II/IV secretion system protein [Candidatus Sungbacteria bacterium]|nr:type II/IV secretion system protein [Candidatus Sungbacteria bacterium]